jgi:hypothetical protein
MVIGARATVPDDEELVAPEELDVLVDDDADEVLEELDVDVDVLDELAPPAPPVPLGAELEQAEEATAATGDTSIAAQKARRSETDLSIISKHPALLALESKLQETSRKQNCADNSPTSRALLPQSGDVQHKIARAALDDRSRLSARGLQPSASSLRCMFVS